MLHLPPLSQIFQHACGPTPQAGSDPAASGQPQRATINATQDEGQLAGLPDMDGPIAPAHVQAATQQRQQDLRNRARIDALLTRLQAGDGVAVFQPQDPTGKHFCFRYQNNVLALGSHAAFLAGQEPAFVLQMQGSGLMARHDGAWIENPDTAFFEALDAASRSAQQAFIN